MQLERFAVSTVIEQLCGLRLLRHNPGPIVQKEKRLDYDKVIVELSIVLLCTSLVTQVRIASIVVCHVKLGAGDIRQ